MSSLASTCDHHPICTYKRLSGAEGITEDTEVVFLWKWNVAGDAIVSHGMGDDKKGENGDVETVRSALQIFPHP